MPIFVQIRAVHRPPLHLASHALTYRSKQCCELLTLVLSTSSGRDGNERQEPFLYVFHRTRIGAAVGAIHGTLAIVAHRFALMLL